MFSDRLAQLLTGYIDGELSARKQRAVKRLLRRSPEARQLLRELEQDSREIQMMSRKRCDVDMGSRVLHAISERQLSIKRRPIIHRFYMPTWLGYAAAAGVLIAVFYGSYQFSLNLHGSKPGDITNDVARNQTHTETPAPVKNDTRQPNHVEPKPEPPLPNVIVDRTPTPEPEKTPVVPKEPEKPVVVKNEPSAKPEVPEPPTVDIAQSPEPMDLGRPRSKLEVFEMPGNLKIYSDLALRDLGDESKQLKLLEELHNAPSHRIELYSLGTSIGFDKLDSTFNRYGIGLIIDSQCLYRMQNPYWRTDFAVYLENVKPEEVVALATQLGRVDRKLQAAVLPFTQDDHKELSNLIGIDPTKLEAPKPQQLNIREPIQKATLKQLRLAPPRPQANGLPLITRRALVVPCNPVHPDPSSSREIKRFMEQRKRQEPGTIQVLFVIRDISGS